MSNGHWTYDQIIHAQNDDIEADRAQANAELEAGRLAGDANRVKEAADRILDLDVRQNALAVRARGYYAAQATQPQQNPLGLSPTESEIARKSRSDLPAQQAEQLYAANKFKMRSMIANGTYGGSAGGRSK